MTYQATDIAKYIINKCTIEKHAISNLQLQEILYYMSTILIHTLTRNAINNNGVVAKPFYKGKSCYTSIRFSVKYSNMR